MDCATLLASEPLWGEETTPLNRDLPRLTPDEQTLYNELRDQRLGKSLRLEQERIPFYRVETALNTLCAETA